MAKKRARPAPVQRLPLGGANKARAKPRQGHARDGRGLAAGLAHERVRRASTRRASSACGARLGRQAQCAALAYSSLCSHFFSFSFPIHTRRLGARTLNMDASSSAKRYVGVRHARFAGVRPCRLVRTDALVSSKGSCKQKHACVQARRLIERGCLPAEFVSCRTDRIVKARSMRRAVVWLWRVC